MPTPGPLELIIILVIALLVLGPGKLPEVGSALGRSIREFRKAAADVQDAVQVDPSPRPSATPTTASPAAPPNTGVATPPAEATSEPTAEPRA
jgi:sec-independent protein translocase protein TatA